MRAALPGRPHPGRLVRRLRPSRPGRLARVSLAAVGLVAALAVVLFVGGTAASMLYARYGLHPEQDARVWAGRELVFAGSTSCGECHAAEATTIEASDHAGVHCESCHGAQAAHVTTEAAKAAAGASTWDAGTAGASTTDAAPARALEAAAADPALDPSGRICVTCHEQILGRPAAIAQVDPSTHYGIGSCLRCHDAHSTQVMRPPVVLHPLANMPECRVCHGEHGLNPAPVGHVDSDDEVCLGCHSPASAGR